jgi:hypothetical protein
MALLCFIFTNGGICGKIIYTLIFICFELGEYSVDKINEIINQFEFSGNLKECRLFGSGHINNTYLLTFEDGGKAQKISCSRLIPTFSRISKA